MGNISLVGVQWGDEGKGKMVDWLSERADIVVRFQGGNNAGHTLVIDGETYKLSLLPSGIVRRGKLSIIGPGVVIDPHSLLDEIDRVRAQGIHISPENLVVSEKSCLVTCLHRELDEARESNGELGTIGTTKRGIGPAYEDKVGRRAIRVCDLRDPDGLPGKIEHLLSHHNILRKGLNLPTRTVDEVLEPLVQIAPSLLQFVQPAWDLLEKGRMSGKKVLFEGAQGVMLDVDHGTYPFVTSSNTVPGQAAAGAGVGPSELGYVLGICKAYTTRVGEGPFPTEIEDEIGQRIGARGGEFGVVTGRKRRCGWFDAAMVRKSLKISGVHGIALTKLDVLDGLETIKICKGYRLDGREVSNLPPEIRTGLSPEPIYEEMEGWSESTEGARHLNDLPDAASAYLRRVEELIECPLALVSTSPEREDVIWLKDDVFH